MNSLILQTATRFLLPLLLLFSVFLLLRGHNLPGGGFSGGLVAASAVILYGFAFGVAQARRSLRFDLRVLIGSGLLVAIASGAMALFATRPWMTGLWITLPMPGSDPVHLGTPLLFDLGVYLVVTGVTLLIIASLGEE